MRRTFALIALLAVAWPHVAALECALGTSPAGPRGGAPTQAHPHHAPTTAESDHRQHTHAAAEGGGLAPSAAAHPETDPAHGDCTLVMACGVPMIPVLADGDADGRPGPDLVGPTTAFGTPTTTDLSADPPPPRRIA